MVRRHDPLFQRRRLRSELRRLRVRRGVTQKAAAQDLEWSPSKLVRIETGVVGISLTDLRALLAYYGVTDNNQIGDLVEAARDSRKPAWWSQYKDLLDPRFLELLSYENSASVIRDFNPLLLPGLMQTEDYARALIKEQVDVSPSVEERLVQARLERQKLIYSDERPEMFFILDEAVLRRSIGGRDAMVRQTQHLRNLAELPRVHIQLVSFDVGAYSGLWGPFVIFDLTDDRYDDLTESEFLVFLENSGGDYLFRDDPQQSSRYVERFIRLEEIATPKVDIFNLLDDAISRLA